MREEGATLIEVLVAAAVGMMMAAALFSLGRGSNAFGARAATDALGAEAAYARSLAASDAYGASIVFQPVGGGFTATLYRGRPGAPGGLRASGWPGLSDRASIREAAAGPPPFTVVFDGAGRAALAGMPGCPEPAGTVTLLLGPGSADRLTLPCLAP